MKRYKRYKDYGFFDQDIRLSKLSQLGDPLEKLNDGIDFEKFRRASLKNHYLQNLKVPVVVLHLIMC